MTSITLSPPNSLIFVMDHSCGELPEAMNGQLVAFTDSCVAVGTLSVADGETTITLTDSLEGVRRGQMVFDGVLKVPRRELAVCSAADEMLLTMKVPRSEARVQIFANDASEPDQIVVFVDTRGTAQKLELNCRRQDPLQFTCDSQALPGR